MSACQDVLLTEQEPGALIVKDVTCEVLLIETGSPGRPGAPGSSGGAGGSSYIYTQAVPSAIWTVAHNLDRRPSVSVVDHLGNAIYGDVRWIDNNFIQVTHGTPLIGAVYCN